MAKLARGVQKIFASTAGANEVEQIGSLRNGAQNFTTDPATLQALTQYLEGLKSIVSATTLIPELSDLNGLYFLITRQLAYIFQEGISEWDTSTIYFINSMVKKVGTQDIYISLTDNNAGNAVTDATKWELLSLNVKALTASGAVKGATGTFDNMLGVVKSQISAQKLDTNGYGAFSGGKGLYEVESYSGSTDDMVKLTGGVSYQMITIMAKQGHTITIKDDAAHALIGGFTCGGDKVLTGNTFSTATFIWYNDSWNLTGYQAN